MISKHFTWNKEYGLYFSAVPKRLIETHSRIHIKSAETQRVVEFIYSHDTTLTNVGDVAVYVSNDKNLFHVVFKLKP